MAKDYLRYRMTGVLNTEVTDAGNTLLFDEERETWDEDLIARTWIRREIFPEVRRPLSFAGNLLPDIAKRCGLSREIPVFCGGADMACSQIGTGSIRKGTVAVTLSTSGQICMRHRRKGQRRVRQSHLPSGDPEKLWICNGSVFSGGLALNWCYQMLNGLDKMEKKDQTEMNLLAEAAGRLGREERHPVSAVPDRKRVAVFLPGGPGNLPWTLDSGGPRGLFRSVRRGSHFNIRESTELLVRMGGEADTVYVSGGGTHIRVWTQILTDVLGVPVHILEEPDASTLGAALTAAAGGGSGK